MPGFLYQRSLCGVPHGTTWLHNFQILIVELTGYYYAQVAKILDDVYIQRKQSVIQCKKSMEFFIFSGDI
ncbi:MAG TPA: hypothetical protein DHW02_13745 [Ktedonobacter sp.]|nr:hypothetical protein [Ktedonobacter sp.]